MKRNAFGEFLKEKRIPVAFVAEKIGVTRQAIWSKTVYPYDPRSLKLGYIKKIADGINIDPLELMDFIIKNENGE